MAEQSSKVKIIFGCMDIGRKLEAKEGHACIEYMLEEGMNNLDTAFMYANGTSEEIMGHLPACNNPEKTIIATKANPLHGKKLTADSIRTQLTTSLSNLKRAYADLFYLHMPDHDTEVEESLSEVQKLYEEGLIKEFGLSNYKSWEVVDVYHICKSKGWKLPTVYQGMYNPVTRSVEGELFPALRKFGMRFDAYNPLAGGILSGKHRFTDKQEDKIREGRFQGNSASMIYQDRFWNEALFKTLDLVQAALIKAYGADHGVTQVEAALRWMLHHSQLSGEHGDGLILGASSLQQCKENLEACRKGPLHPEVVAAYEEAWQLNKETCPSYYR